MTGPVLISPNIASEQFKTYVAARIKMLLRGWTRAKASLTKADNHAASSHNEGCGYKDVAGDLRHKNTLTVQKRQSHYAAC